MNLPDFDLLVSIHNQYEEIKLLQNTLLVVQGELDTEIQQNQLQSLVEEKRIKAKLETKFKRKNIGLQITGQRVVEKTTKKKITKKVSQLIEEYSLDAEKHQAKLEKLLVQKIKHSKK